MEVILLERIEKLGQMGDIVRVKDGFARNYLLPKSKALRATKANLAQFETQRVQLEARNLEQKAEAGTVGETLDGQTFVIIRQAGDGGQLYGSVSTRDVANQIVAGGVTVVRNQVVLERPIKTLGIHPIRVNLHPEVSVTVSVNVARTEEEAERQARGEDVTMDRFDEGEDEAIPAEEVFEDEADAEEAEAALAEETAEESDET